MNSMTVKKSAGETCVVCDDKKQEGIHLFTQFICKDCEKEIVDTETDDFRYVFFLKKLKTIAEKNLNC